MKPRQEAFAAIVLAAGAGRRFGGRKLMAAFQGRPLILGALDAAFAAPAKLVVLATNHDAELASTAQDHAQAVGREADLQIVVVNAAEEGLGVSLRTAAAHLPDDVDGAFVFLGDMPRIPPTTPQALAQAFGDGRDLVAPRHQGRRGHPVLFGKAWFPALRALSGDTGGQALFTTAGDRLAHVEIAEDGVLFDVDRPSDLTFPPSMTRSQP